VDLGRQSLGRPLSASEIDFARSLEAIFATGVHDFDSVVHHLHLDAVARPSGSTDAWTVDALQAELRLINDAQDAAYMHRPTAPRGQ